MAAMCVWKFNGTQLFYDQPPSNLKLSCVEFANRKTMTLKIHNVSRRDAGLYECGVSNGPGNAWNTITLLVGEKGKNALNICFGFKRTVKLHLPIRGRSAFVHSS